MFQSVSFGPTSSLGLFLPMSQFPAAFIFYFSRQCPAFGFTHCFFTWMKHHITGWRNLASHPETAWSHHKSFGQVKSERKLGDGYCSDETPWLKATVLVWHPPPAQFITQGSDIRNLEAGSFSSIPNSSDDDSVWFHGLTPYFGLSNPAPSLFSCVSFSGLYPSNPTFSSGD